MLPDVVCIVLAAVFILKEAVYLPQEQSQAAGSSLAVINVALLMPDAKHHSQEHDYDCYDSDV
jgi:hypothetical protein